MPESKTTGLGDTYILRGGLVVDPVSESQEAADLLVAGGRIEAIGLGLEAPEGAAELDVAGALVCPGLIDIHAHLREPGREDKETIESGTKAAVRGGYTAVACMPNTEPAIDSQETVSFVLERAARYGACRVLPVAAITAGRKGLALTEMFELADAGAVAFSDDGDSVADSGVMRRALEYASMSSLPIISHCEDKALVGKGVMHEGALSTRLGLRGIPSASEEVMVARDINLAALTSGRLHLTHLSSAGSVALVRDAKARGLRVTADVTPHHLALTHEAVIGYGTSFKVNPPLRTEQDREALMEGLCDGTIDCVGTDHAPHTDIEKDVEFDAAPFGAIGLETAVGVLFTYCVRAGHMSAARLISRLTVGPAAALGLRDFGALTPGCRADVTVIDPEVVWTVDPADFASKSTNTPFAGLELFGAPILTIVGGALAYMGEGIGLSGKLPSRVSEMAKSQ
jgi:dihydroorotase